jgi:hypothetical protein
MSNKSDAKNALDSASAIRRPETATVAALRGIGYAILALEEAVQRISSEPLQMAGGEGIDRGQIRVLMPPEDFERLKAQISEYNLEPCETCGSFGHPVWSGCPDAQDYKSQAEYEAAIECYMLGRDPCCPPDQAEG